MNGSNGEMAMADSLGEFLRRERELRHISLDDVAERTKISRRYLEALEDERYERLPGETFVRGFIRSYAQSVGLDPEDTLLIYSQSRVIHGAESPRAEPPSPAGHAWNEHLFLWLLLIGVVVVGGVLASAVGRLGVRNLPRWAAPPAPQMSNTLSAAPPLLLTVSADSDTWLRVTIDDREPQDLVLLAGQSTKWIGQERFILSIGNARTTHLRLNGHDLSTPQAAQSILRQYTISREMLP
jgi:cytoskeleton protein RodZ